MKSPGFDKPLCVLPTYTPRPFQKKMFGWEVVGLNTLETSRIAYARQVIYDGSRAAIEFGLSSHKTDFLLNEHSGKPIEREVSCARHP
jgi:hypothetical protein